MKNYCNPLDENSTLNMDKGGSEGGGLFPIVPPATNVHPKKCNHVEGEIEGYDNFGMYHIGSGVCKKCGRSMIDWNKPYGTYLKRTDNMDKWGQGESRKVGGHSYSPKPSKVHLSKREELLKETAKAYCEFRNKDKVLDPQLLEDIVEIVQDWHISEMKELLERVKNNLNLLPPKCNRLNRFRCLSANAIYNEVIFEFHQSLNSLMEELK